MHLFLVCRLELLCLSLHLCSAERLRGDKIFHFRSPTPPGTPSLRPCVFRPRRALMATTLIVCVCFIHDTSMPAWRTSFTATDPRGPVHDLWLDHNWEKGLDLTERHGQRASLTAAKCWVNFEKRDQKTTERKSIRYSEQKRYLWVMHAWSVARNRVTGLTRIVGSSERHVIFKTICVMSVKLDRLYVGTIFNSSAFFSTWWQFLKSN